MPVKHGGLGIRKVGENSEAAHHASQRITNPLVEQIIKQSDQLPSKTEETEARSTTVKMLKEVQAMEIEELTSKQSPDLKRILKQHSEHGASSWLNALPLEEQGFNLNKGEFRDALSLRYNNTPRNLPTKCPCGEKFNVTHALDCKRGGFVNARHDNIKNFEAKMVHLVCNDVEVEPQLQPVEGGKYQKSANTSVEARPDIRARGFWRDGQNAFFDVRVTNPACESQKNMSLKSILNKHEQEKKRQYNQRIMNIEHGTFTPLVYTTTGVMGHECDLYHKALADRISRKKGDRYDDIMQYLRTKLSFLALKSTLLCLRGSRSVFTRTEEEQGGDFSLRLSELRLQ